MSEEESIIEITKPKFSKLAIVAFICGLFSVLTHYLAITFLVSYLWFVEGQLVEPWCELVLVVLGLSVLVPLLLYIASVVLWRSSLTVIKRSRGKLRGNRLAFAGVVVSTAHITIWVIQVLINVKEWID